MKEKIKIQRPLVFGSLTKLTDTEKLVIKYINEFNSEIFTLTQKELALKSFTSEPTISRLIKKLGYKSYKEFVYQINYILVELNQKYPIYNQKNINGLVNNIINAHTYASTNTIDKNIINKLEKLAHIINQKRKIIVWGLGASNKIAKELTVNLQRIGIVAYCPEDLHVLLPILASFSEKDLILFLSNSGQNKEITFCIKQANAQKIYSVLVSSNYHPIAIPNLLINYNLICNTQFLTPVSSKTIQNLICDILFHLIINTNKKYKEQISKSMLLIKQWRMITK